MPYDPAQPLAPPSPADDPRPQPPREPDVFDCCGNECGDACVWTIHQRLKKEYEEALDAWLLRQL